MKKIIIKTAFTTLACIIGLGALIYGLIGVISPLTLAKSYGELGNYNISVKYYEKQYKKNLDTKDLYELVVRLDAEKDAKKTAKYAQELIAKPDFRDFCSANGGDAKFSTNEFVYAKLVTALKVINFDEAILVCSAYYGEYGYTSFNPYRALMILDLSSEEKDKLIDALKDLEESNQEIQEDIKLLE